MEIVKIATHPIDGNINLHIQYRIENSDIYGLMLEYTKEKGYEFIGPHTYRQNLDDVTLSRMLIEELFTSKHRVKAISSGLVNDSRVWRN